MEWLLSVGLSNAVLATVLALVAACVSRVCRRPALIHGLWLLVLLRLVMPPIVPVPITWGIASDTTVTALQAPNQTAELAPTLEISAGALARTVRTAVSAADPASVGPVESEIAASELSGLMNAAAPAETVGLWTLSWQSVAAWFWLTGSVLWFAVAMLRIVRFCRCLRHAKPASEDLVGRMRALAQRLGLRQCPCVWLIPGTVSPMLWYLGTAPSILLPSRLLDQLDEDQQETLLVHELAHLRRNDHWVRLIELIVLGLYWWHPVVWWARSELREAEEQCCDGWVVWALPRGARAYATALVATVGFLSQARLSLPMSASGIGHVRHLRRRVIMIMRGPAPQMLGRLGFLAVLGLGAVLLPLMPALGEQDAPPRRDGEERRREERQAAPRRGEREDKGEPRRAEGQPPRERRDSERPGERGPRDDDRGRSDADAQRERARDQEREAQRHQIRLQVEQMEAQVQAARAQLEAAMAQLRVARERLEQLERQGGEGPRDRQPGRDRPPGAVGGIPGPPGGPPRAEGGPGFPRPGVGGGLIGRPQVPGGPHLEAERRFRELEQKLDRVLQEVERLRNEQNRGPFPGRRPQSTPPGARRPGGGAGDGPQPPRPPAPPAAGGAPNAPDRPAGPQAP